MTEQGRSRTRLRAAARGRRRASASLMPPPPPEEARRRSDRVRQGSVQAHGPALRCSSARSCARADLPARARRRGTADPERPTDRPRSDGSGPVRGRADADTLGAAAARPRSQH